MMSRIDLPHRILPKKDLHSDLYQPKMTCRLEPLIYIQVLPTSLVYTSRTFEISWLQQMDFMSVEAIDFPGLAPLHLFFCFVFKGT